VYEVIFTPQSIRDLDKLESLLTNTASRTIAANYVDSIVEHCSTLALSPHRGEHRPYVGKGIRTIGYRNVSIHFRVDDHKQEVSIARIKYAGQMRESHL
jgi:toxin ParE1/3/4